MREIVFGQILDRGIDESRCKHSEACCPEHAEDKVPEYPRYMLHSNETVVDTGQSRKHGDHFGKDPVGDCCIVVRSCKIDSVDCNDEDGKCELSRP